MEADLGTPLTSLSADGGATGNELLMQIQADLIGSPIARSSAKELSAIGAGVMAGVAAGLWNDEVAAARFASVDRTFRPSLAKEERDRRLAGWTAAVRLARQGGVSAFAATP